MKRYGVVLGVLLAGCGQEANEAPADTSIILECSGERIDLVKETRESGGYLIRVNPGNQFVGSLHYFSAPEKRFISPCIENGFQCEVSVTPDMINELGTMKSSSGEVLHQKATEINRRTGAMKIVSISSLGEQPMFEGTCRKGQAPVEEAQKF